MKTITAKYQCKFCGKIQKAEAVEFLFTEEDKKKIADNKPFECICDKCSNKD